MNNHQSKSTLLKFQSEAIVNKNHKLNENIKSLQSNFKINFGPIEKERSSEMLYNELKIKNTGVKGLFGEKEENNNINKLELLFKNRNEAFLSAPSDPSEGKGNNNLNSLYLTKSLVQYPSINMESDLPPILRKAQQAGLDLNHQTLLPYLNSLTQFNKRLAKHQHVFYQFNKANNKSLVFLFDKTSKLLNLTFLAMGCLMSRPIYKVIYSKKNLEFEHNTALQNPSINFTPKILIDLSYFIRKNQNRYLYNNVEVNDNIIHISHPDNINSGLIDPVNTNDSLLADKVSQRNNILCKYNDRFQILTDCLNSMFKSEVELDLVRLHKVFYDGHILVQDIALKSYKFRFVKLVSRLFKRLHIQKVDYSNNLDKANGLSSPSYLSGINIKLAGRTFRQRVIPRMTVKRIQKGSLTNVNVQFIDRARFTGKTRRGAFSFTITLGHVFK